MALTVGTPTTSTSDSFSHTSAGATSILVVLIACERTSAPTLSATYAGTAMTKVDGRDNGNGKATYALYLEDPTSGSNTVSITSSGLGAFRVVAVNVTSSKSQVLYDTSDGSSVGAGGATTTWQEALTTTKPTGVLFGVACVDGSYDPSTSDTELYSGNTAGTLGWNHAWCSTTTTGSYSIDWTTSSNTDWSSSAIHVYEEALSSISPSISPSSSPSQSPSSSASPSISKSPSPSESASSSPSQSPSSSASPSASTSASASPSESPSSSLSPSASPSTSKSISPSASPSISKSPSPSVSASISPSPSPTAWTNRTQPTTTWTNRTKYTS